jgi:hypothetical protein
MVRMVTTMRNRRSFVVLCSMLCWACLGVLIMIMTTIT